MPQVPIIHDSPLFPILEASSDGIGLVIPKPWRLVYENSTLAQWLRLAPGDLTGREVEDVFFAAGLRGLSAQLDRVLRGDDLQSCVFEEWVLPGGESKSVEIRLRPIEVDGERMAAIVVRDCASATRRETVPIAVGRDPLTGLADRSVLLARMAALLRGDRAADRKFAVLFIDLDDFKQVNDAHGHLVGDRVLVEVSRRLAGCVRTGDLIVRFGGDEFVALVERVADLSEVQPVIDRIDAALARPIALPEGEVTLSVSVGASEAAAEHQTPEDLLRDADRAMYASKRLPR